MLMFLIRRILAMAGTLLVVSALIFIIINLPPGDYLSNEMAELQAQGEAQDLAKLEWMRAEYSIDQPIWKQYLIWVGLWPHEKYGFDGLLQGNYGWSFALDQPVSEVLGESVWLTVIVNLASLLFIYGVSLPLGVIAAVYAGKWLDYVIAFVGYIGLATPNFLLALILLYYGKQYLDLPIGGLMDPRFEGRPWTLEKIQSVLAHLIIPTIVIGTAGTASMIRRLRANMLDEMRKPYVTTAQAKGLRPTPRLIRYPLRAALNPFVADIGNLLPSLVSGSVLVSAVMSLPTLGPLLLDALRSQDHFLAGFILLFVSALTLVGMLVSDILLGLLDPRIRFGAR